MHSANAEVIALVNDAEQKIDALAEALSDEQWGYRPAEGVRSASQVFMHVAGANYMLPGMLGVRPPADFPITMGPEGPVGMAEYEARSGRETVMEAMDASFNHVRSALEGVSEDQMGNEVEFFGQTMTVRGFCMMMATHLHEHLGQLIAYARANGVVPSWTFVVPGVGSSGS